MSSPHQREKMTRGLKTRQRSLWGHPGGSLSVTTLPLVLNSHPNPEAYRSLGTLVCFFLLEKNALELNDNGV